MSKVSKDDLDSLKSMSENAQQDWQHQNVASRSSAYLSIETINQLKKNTVNNIMFTILGTTLGFLSSFTVAKLTQSKLEEDLQQLSRQVREVKLQINHFQKYQSKKDSLQTSSKKN